MLMGMGLNRSSLDKLRTKAATEEVAWIFDTIFLQIQSSNYTRGIPYTGMTLTLSWWENQISYAYTFKGNWKTKIEWEADIDWAFWWEFTIVDLTGDGKLFKEVSIIYTTFQHSCEMKGNGKEIDELFSL